MKKLCLILIMVVSLYGCNQQNKQAQNAPSVTPTPVAPPEVTQSTEPTATESTVETVTPPIPPEDTAALTDPVTIDPAQILIPAEPNITESTTEIPPAEEATPIDTEEPSNDITNTETQDTTTEALPLDSTVETDLDTVSELSNEEAVDTPPTEEAEQTITEEPIALTIANVGLTCEFLGFNDTGEPSAKIFATFGEDTVEIDDTDNCEGIGITPEDYNKFNIPSEAETAVYSLHNGKGEYYYMTATTDSATVFKAEAEGDSTINYEIFKEYNASQTQ